MLPIWAPTRPLQAIPYAEEGIHDVQIILSCELHIIKPEIAKYPTHKQKRIAEILICRLRMSHAPATCSYRINGTPISNKCGGRISVLHLLVTSCTPSLEAVPSRYTACNDTGRQNFSNLYTWAILLPFCQCLVDEPLFSTNRLLLYLQDMGFLCITSNRM